MKIAERRVRQWSNVGADVEMLTARPDARHAGHGRLVRRLLNRTGGHINPLALARGLARSVLRAGGRIYRPPPGHRVRARGRPLGGEDETRRRDCAPAPWSWPPTPTPGILQSALPGHRAAGGARAVLADGDAAADGQRARNTIIPGRQAMSDTHGELYFARYDARNRLVTGGAVARPLQPAPNGSSATWATACAAVAADRRGAFRLRLERLCRHDDGFPAAHSPLGPDALAWAGCNGRAVALSVALGGNWRRRCAGARRGTRAALQRAAASAAARLLRNTSAADAARLPPPGRAGARVRRSPVSEHRGLVFPGELAPESGQQRLRIGVLRIAEDLAGQPLLHHLAVLHHRDEVADLRRDAQVMGDEDDRQAEPLRADPPAASAPAPAPKRRARRRARPPPAPPARAPARGQARCAGAGRRRIHADSARSQPGRDRRARSSSLARASACARGMP